MTKGMIDLNRMRKQFQTIARWSSTALFTLVFLSLVHVGVSADMRITMIIDEHAIEETLVKGSQVIIAQGADNRTIYDCILEQYTFISDEKEQYWRGSLALMTEQLRARVAPMIAALEHHFGDSLAVSLKFTHLGEDVIEGYDVERYLIEESSGGDSWGEREELWLSRQLADEIRQASEACHNIGEEVAKLQLAFLSLVYGPDNDALDNYYALFDGAFPARMRVNTIGGWHDRRIADVSTAELSDELFHLPDHYLQADSIVEVMD